MKPVLFLDFDGPLFPERHIPHSRHIDEYPGIFKLHPWITYWEMDLTSVRQLNALYDIFPFDTVVSSSWKRYCSKENIEDLFQVNELKLHLHDRWATPQKMSSYRVNEICWWLDEATIREEDKYICPSHIILDDPWSGSYLEDTRGHGMQEAYMINPDLGIDSDVFRSMLSQVKSWRDDYQSRRFTRVFPTRDWDGIIPVETR